MDEPDPSPAQDNPAPLRPASREAIRRRAVRAVLWLASIYVLVAIVVVVCEDRLAFPGWTIKREWRGFPKKCVVEELTIRTSDGNAINAWWLPPPNWTPADGALLYAHGNGGNISSYGGALRRWRDELRTGVIGFDYPGYGRSTGAPNEQSCYAAAQATLDWLIHEKKVAREDIVFVGVSMGGAMATELASQHRCRLLLTSGTFTSFPDIAQESVPWLPARYLARSRFDNEFKMEQLESPVFICHGTADRVVPFAHGERLFAAVKGPKRFFPMPGKGHAPPKTREFFATVREFLEETKRVETAHAAASGGS